MRGGSSERLAELLSEYFETPILNALTLKSEAVQKKATQGLLSRMMQENNFKLTESAHHMQNQCILIADDFSTTGKTIADAIELVESQSPKHIMQMVLAARKSQILEQTHQYPVRSLQLTESHDSFQNHQ